jgi:imidazolonepropionase-like amidohydrolase
MIVFEDVAVVPMDAEHLLEHQTVLIENDRIKWVKPTRDAVPPQAAQRVDGRGKYLLPGLADMHCHPGDQDQMLLFVAHGVTMIRIMWGMPRHLKWRQQIERGEMIGPRIHTTGPFLAGAHPRRNWSTVIGSKREAIDAVVGGKSAGYDSLKVYDELSPQAYGWLMDAAADHGLPVYGHVPHAVGLDGVLQAGQRSLEHLYGYLEAAVAPETRLADPVREREMVLHRAESVTDDRCAELAEATLAAGAWNCPTLLARRRWLQDRSAIPANELRYLRPREAEMRKQYTAQVYPKLDDARQLWPLYVKMLKALRDADAGLLAGTDSGLPMYIAGMSLHEELEAMVEAGLSPFQALRAATSEAARFLGEYGEWGIVADGARADVVLVDGNPLVDISNTSKISGTVIAGQWFPIDKLRQELDQLTERRQEPPTKPVIDRPASRPPQHAQTYVYEVEQAGVTVATEEIALSFPSAGGQLLQGKAQVNYLFNEPGMDGVEAGLYYTEVETDADGVDQVARFDHEGLDGRDHLELIREHLQLRIRQEGSSGERVEMMQAPANVLLSRTLIMLWVQLAHHARDLAVGETRTLLLIGPGLPPDINIYTNDVFLERLADEIAAGRQSCRHYSFQLRRPNLTAYGTFMCDLSGWPIEIRFPEMPSKGNPATLVRRIANLSA